MKEFLSWLKQVLRKWWLWLGLLPLLLDLVYAYIPAAYIPPQIGNLLKVGANWQLTLVLVTIGLLVVPPLSVVRGARRLSADP